jgi:hypothetical protein
MEVNGLSTEQRARQLALSLLELGETMYQTELQLRRWRYSEDERFEALDWAEREYLRRNGQGSLL